MVDFAGSNVVVTGGTGALGRAVIGALRAAGAVCHVPNLVAAELDEFPYASDPGVHIARGVDLAEERAVRGFYQTLPPLWASVHLAGRFAVAPIRVNAVAPSVLDTPANRAAMPDADPRRWVAPADLAEIIVFLASPANRVTRGAVIPVYGGS